MTTDPTSRALGRRGAGLGLLALLVAACGCSADGDLEAGPGPDGVCGAERSLCGSSCVDLTTDGSNCGACGVACAVGQSCSNGSCACVPGLTLCGASCVDTNSNGEHCGGCGVACLDAVCAGGSCRENCLPGQTQCGSSCVDLSGDLLNCGACEHACAAGQSCVGGLCDCPSGLTNCDGFCVDLGGNGAHCGACGVACSWNQSCVAGRCTDLGGTGGTGGVSTGGVSTGGVSTGGVSTGGGGSTSCDGGVTRSGFFVADGRLYDHRCHEFVMRGVNYPYAWFASRNTQQDFQAIAATGANAVRVVLATGDRWNRVGGATLTGIISAAKDNQLIAVLEVHDTTGWSEQSGSVELARATTYWTSQDILSALTGQEAYALINIGNEPMGNTTTANWASHHATAITALRNAGLTHTLVVDAPNWGQDWSRTMLDGSDTTQIWNADPDRNLVFSIHMYDVYGDAQSVTNYFTNFLDRTPAMPLVVGEFAADHGASGNVDEDTILRLSQVNRVGYLGWSWSGNSSDLSSLDITNGFDPSNLTTWGNRLIHGSDGISATSSVCTCFD